MSPVLGTGIDLVENDRVRDMIDRWGARFTDRVFCPAEQAYCQDKAFPHQHYAARFAVKEAVAKALGTGISPQVGWRCIEVTRNGRSGAPSVRLHGPAADFARRLGVAEILVSLSHTRNHAVASATLLAERRKGVPDDHR